MKNIVICLLVVCPILAFSQKKMQNLDTVFVTKGQYTTIFFDARDTINLVAPGSANYAGSYKNKNTVFVTAVTPSKECSSLFIRYNGNKYFTGNICYKEVMRALDLIYEFPRGDSIKSTVNPIRDITFDKESIEKQLMDRSIGVVQGREKDRFKGRDGTVVVEGKIFLKLQDIMQDNFYLYLKLVLGNSSKEEYLIESVDFVYRNVNNGRDYKQIFPEGSNGVKKVEAKSKHESVSMKHLVFALPRFTITSDWKLFVTVKEGSGTRKIELEIPYKIVKEAEILN